MLHDLTLTVSHEISLFVELIFNFGYTFTLVPLISNEALKGKRKGIILMKKSQNDWLHGIIIIVSIAAWPICLHGVFE